MRSLFLLLTITLVAAAAQADTPSLVETLASDATLHAVEPLDSMRAWAVGDRGLMLRTDNGGRNWRRVITSTDVPLYDISFIDADHGWAVGGATRPYTHLTRGVVLRTTDGGIHWKPIDHGPLPQLRSVRFFDKKHGIAAGTGSSFSPAGVYETTDGGRTWRPLPSSATWRWTAGDFYRDADGVLASVMVGARGAAGRLSGHEVVSATGYSDRRGYHAARLTDASHGWLVGDGALVRTTRDSGRTWRAPEGQFPDTLADWFNWHAVEAHGSHAWIAGSPGSLILSTDNAGETWQLAPTGITTPLCDIAFADEQHGWAVGELGVILVTTDGGQTWRPQRHPTHRAAIAMIAGDPAQIPAELLATNAAAEGNRSVVIAPFAPESHTAAATLTTSVAEAASLCGADALATGWRLPLEVADLDLPADALAELLDHRSDGDALQTLAQRLATVLLTYRPEVVVTPQTETNDFPGVAELLQAATERAIELAAIEPPPETYLTAWQPRRVLTVGPIVGRATGDRFATGDFSSLLGASPAQWTRNARGLLSTETAHRAAPSAYAWQYVAGEPAPNDRHGNLAAGLGLRRGSDTRRPASLTPTGQLDELRRLAQKRRNMERLLEGTKGNPAWAGQVVDLTGGLDTEAGAELLHQLAEGYRASGHLDMAADTLYLLGRRYPESPLADASLLWLVRYYASGERAHADARHTASQSRPTDTLANRTATSLATPSAIPSTTEPLTPEARRERANRLADFLHTARPELYADPGLRLAEAAASRARGFSSDAEKTALLLSKQAIAADWQRAALAELWLAKPEGLPPEKPIASCRRTSQRPKLDGQLNDPAWKKTEPILLRSEGGQPDADIESCAVVRFAHDAEFLYIAAEVPNSNLVQADTKAPRLRDADLTPYDRIRIRIDIDRDYATAYELTIDQRGWTHDSLWGDRHWQPQWFVATDDSITNTWRFELAIPLSELAPPEELRRAAWAVSIDRLRPAERATNWTGTPSASTSPDAFGLLLFD